jgi:hypothetical protein
LEDAHTMSATQTPTPAPSAEDAFAAAVQDLAAGMHAPEGAPPAAETPAAPPETPPAPAEGDRGTPPTPPAEEIKPPAPDWEARISELERKHENDRRADIARLNAERQRAETAERERDEATQRSAEEIDQLWANARDEARRAGNEEQANVFDGQLKLRQLERRERTLEDREGRVRQTEQVAGQTLARQDFVNMLADTPRVMAGAVPELLKDLTAEFPDLDPALLEQQAQRFLARPAIKQRMGETPAIPTRVYPPGQFHPREVAALVAHGLAAPTQDGGLAVYNPLFTTLFTDLQDHTRERAGELRDAKAAQAAAARDTLAPKVAMEGGGAGGAAPRAIKVMDDVTADDWRAALDRG